MRMEIKDDNPVWHDWFAWRPVRIGDRVVWLEWVRRYKSYNPYRNRYDVEYLSKGV